MKGRRCHILHDKAEHLRRRRLTYLARRALGDLFTGHTVTMITCVAYTNCSIATYGERQGRGLRGRDLNIVQGTQRPAPLRPDRGIISVIEGGMSDASTIAGQERFGLPSIPDNAQPVALTPRNYQTALSLLECAAKALEILYDRRDQLEASLEDVSTRAEGAIVAAQAKVLDWQAVASRLKNEMSDLERRLAIMQQRAEAAEAQTEAERTRADSAERRAADAFDLSQGLHSKIMTAFGRGSGAHKALLVAVNQTSDS